MSSCCNKIVAVPHSFCIPKHIVFHHFYCLAYGQNGQLKKDVSLVFVWSGQCFLSPYEVWWVQVLNLQSPCELVHLCFGRPSSSSWANISGLDIRKARMSLLCTELLLFSAFLGSINSLSYMGLGKELDHMFPVPSFWMSENLPCQSCSVQKVIKQVRESMCGGRGQ